MSNPQDPGQQPDPTPPEWQTTEFPAIPRYPVYPPDAQAPQPVDPGGQGYPQYGQPPVGYPADPQYGGGYPPQGPPGPPQGPPAPNNGRRNAIIAAVAVVVAIGAGTGIYFAVSGSDSTTASKPSASFPAPTDTSAPTTGVSSGGTPSTSTSVSPSSSPSPTDTGSGPSSAASTAASGKLRAPTTFGSYTQVTGSSADALTRLFANTAKSDTTGAGALFAASTVGVYGKSGTDLPDLIVVALPARSAPNSLSGEALARSFLMAFPGTPTKADAGSHGGSAFCTSTTGELICSWADSDTAGFVLSVGSTSTTAGLAKIQNQFRDAVS